MESKITIVRPYDNEAIEAHSAKCGGKRNLREVVISTDDNEQFHYLIKKPSRAIMQAVADYEKKNDINKIQSLMLGCVLEGDKEAYEFDGSIYVKLLESISKLVHQNKEELKKL